MPDRLPRAVLRAALPAVLPFKGCRFCPARPLSLRRRTTSVCAPDFPVDVVYTWVDGSDPAHAAKRTAFLPPEDLRRAASQGESLFRDNDELRYSLRSLEAYAPWVRRVFLVTDSQVPDWLDMSHPKICLIDHRDIIPAEYLPTFNSHVIEAFLHRIPDLAEHYIYFNDDVFLASPCLERDFFTPNGLPHIFTDWRRPRRVSYQQARTPHACSHANARRWLDERNIPTPPLITAHGPFPQTRSNAADAYAFFEPAILGFAPNKFRTDAEMAFNCHAAPLWAYAVKRGVPCDLPYYYINTKRPDRGAYYAAILRQQGARTQPLFFCLNDGGGAGLFDWRKDMAEFLEAYYPRPSSFERDQSASRK